MNDQRTSPRRDKLLSIVFSDHSPPKSVIRAQYAGIVPRLIDDMVATRGADGTFSMSCLEIKDNRLIDLLDGYGSARHAIGSTKASRRDDVTRGFFSFLFFF